MTQINRMKNKLERNIYDLGLLLVCCNDHRWLGTSIATRELPRQGNNTQYRLQKTKEGEAASRRTEIRTEEGARMKATLCWLPRRFSRHWSGRRRPTRYCLVGAGGEGARRRTYWTLHALFSEISGTHCSFGSACATIPKPILHKDMISHFEKTEKYAMHAHKNRYGFTCISTSQTGRLKLEECLCSFGKERIISWCCLLETPKRATSK